MKKYIIARHFVNNEESFKGYKEGINRFLSLIDISKTHTYPFEFGLKLTIDYVKLNPDLRDRINSESARLPNDLFYLYDPVNRGPGTSYRQILFNPTFLDQPSIVTLADLDACIIDSEDSLIKILELVEKLEKDKSLYGLGVRIGNFSLGCYKRNSDIRIIHELFHSLVIESIVGHSLGVGGTIPAYAEIGESSTSLTVINLSHSMYPELTKCLIHSSQVANMNSFATDYYVSIKATYLDKKIIRNLVKIRDNPFYGNKSEEEELIEFERLIRNQTRELSKTDIADLISNVVSKNESVDKIAEFYPREDVKIVRDWMRESFVNQQILNFI